MRLNAAVFFLLTVVMVCLAAEAGAQGLEAVPVGLKVINRDDAPVTIRLNGVEVVSRERSALNYSVTNVAGRNIRAVVVLGVPGTAKYSAMFGSALRPGAAETFNGGNLLAKGAKPYRDIAVDFVLFDDGTTWGPNTARDGDYLMGVFEGRRAAYADAERLAGADDQHLLTVWLNSGEIQRNPPGLSRILNTKWSAGFLHGYTRAHETFKRDFERRGAFSIGLRLKAMRRDLGMPSSDATAAKP